MTKIIFLISSLILLSGCGTMITVPIDQTLIEEDKATIIVFHEQGFTDEFKVYFDREPVGVVTSESPLKLSVNEGEHEIHTEVTAAIDRVTKKIYEAGKVYYMKIWLDMGMWVSSIRIDPTNERASYNVKSHKPEQEEYVHTQVKLDLPPLKPYIKVTNAASVVTNDLNKPTVIAESNKLNLPCINRMKNTADYTKSMASIIENNQGSEYQNEINALNAKIEKACSEYNY